MRKALTLGLAVGFGLGAAGTAQAQITGTGHDLRTRLSIDEICVVCHVPHNPTTTQDPLWNHTLTSQNGSYTAYSSTSLDATVDGSLGTESLLCLSCHDGTVAVDSYGGATGSDTLSGDTIVGTDLSNDHPVGFTYDASLATTDGGLYDPTSQSSGITPTGTISADMLFGTGSDQLECASCHDPHSSNTNFLRKANTGSALCLTCHNK